MPELDRRRAAIEERLGALGGAVVALSGGVDSSLVAALAARALGSRAVAVTAVSPALAAGELDGAARVAAAVGIAHETVTTAELRRTGYRANGPDRCYHCKSELYERLAILAAEAGGAAVLSGANADDVDDWRPGLEAAREHRVLHPLVEAGLGKDEVRELARRLGVPSAMKVASPCLASRVPYGTEVDAATLRRIDRAEASVRALGFGPPLRVRHHGALGRVELAEGELAEALTPHGRRAIAGALRSAGYERGEVSERAFRSGSLNDALRRTGGGPERPSRVPATRA